MKSFCLVLSMLGALCSFAQVPSAMIDGHPGWIMQGNIYEVNVRQYSKAGTLQAFGASLERLKKMGVQTLWFMPLNPISRKDRKGSLGSYYAVSDYTALNPEFGQMSDWISLVKEIHRYGMKAIIDWVPNHTGADHHWLKEHPDFFVRDSMGNAAVAQDWADTRQLNYDNPVMQDSMIAAMCWWVDQSDIDGFRCDVAWNVPGAFWEKCIARLRAKKMMFMLAEGDKPYLAKSGFDAVYPWGMFHTMVEVAAGRMPAHTIDSARRANDSLFPAATIQMYFTSNHDENSWNKADFGTFPGLSHAPFAVLSQTLQSSVPLVYGGQEEPVLRALAFFERDPIGFHAYRRSQFYQTLLRLRKSNAALSADATFRTLSVGDSSSVYAYLRMKGKDRVLVILNLSSKPQSIRLREKSLMGNPYNVFMGTHEKLSGKSWGLQPWGYVVYDYNR